MNQPIRIPTERPNIELRELMEADDPIYHESYNASRPEIAAFDPDAGDKHITLADTRDARLNAGNKLRLGIWDNGTFVGGANAKPEDNGGVEIGYWTDSRHTGNGYATLAAKALAARFPNAYAKVVEGNDVSVHVLERAGFKQTAKKAGELIFELSQIKNPEQQNAVSIRNAQLDDLEPLQPVFDHWIRDRNTGSLIEEEVKKVTTSIEASILGENGRTYVTAVDSNNKVVGVMGMVEPGDDMLPYITTDKPIELVNAYVDPTVRGVGIGKKLAAELEARASRAGYTEVIVNSGPRYKEIGWAFWTSLYGEHIDTRPNLYGPGGDAPVWRKSLQVAKL